MRLSACATLNLTLTMTFVLLKWKLTHLTHQFRFFDRQTNRQTDGRTDEQQPYCGLLGRPHNGGIISFSPLVRPLLKHHAYPSCSYFVLKLILSTCLFERNNWRRGRWRWCWRYLVAKSPGVLVQLLKSKLLVKRSFVFLSYDTHTQLETKRT